MQAILNIGIRAIRKAGGLLLRERVRLGVLPSAKAIKCLQTNAETVITEIINKAYPEHDILVEGIDETETHLRTIWRMEIANGLENLLRNIPHYAIVLAISDKNKIKYALVYDPHSEEIFTAVDGGGAQCDGRRLRVANSLTLHNSLWATSALQATQLQFSDLLASLNQQSVSLYSQGCSALSLAYVAAGRVDGFFGSGLSKTVLQAGKLLIQEAGGLIGDLHGGHDYVQKEELMTANPKMFKHILQHFAKCASKG